MHTTNDPTKKTGKFMLVVLLCAVLVGCADPAFSRYIEERRAAIAAMPPGKAKWRAEQQLAAQISDEKQRQRAQADAAVMTGAAALSAGLAAHEQGAPVTENRENSDDFINRTQMESQLLQIQNDLDTIRQEQINRDWNLIPQP
jgi:hypothetical protein